MGFFFSQVSKNNASGISLGRLGLGAGGGFRVEEAAEPAETEKRVIRKIGAWVLGFVLDLAWGIGEGIMEEENLSDNGGAMETETSDNY